MKKIALIQKGRGLLEIVDKAKKFPVHEGSFFWVDAPPNASAQTHRYNFETGYVEPIPAPPEKTIQEIHSEKIGMLKEYRKGKEQGGLTLPNGAIIQTDRDSQSLILGARVAADADANYTVEWKAENGWLTLTAVQIRQISNAVRAHVQACFSAEKIHSENMENFLSNNNKSGLTNYTFEDGWPS